MTNVWANEQLPSASAMAEQHVIMGAIPLMICRLPLRRLQQVSRWIRSVHIKEPNLGLGPRQSEL